MENKKDDNFVLQFVHITVLLVLLASHCISIFLDPIGLFLPTIFHIFLALRVCDQDCDLMALNSLFPSAFPSLQIVIHHVQPEFYVPRYPQAPALPTLLMDLKQSPCAFFT